MRSCKIKHILVAVIGLIGFSFVFSETGGVKSLKSKIKLSKKSFEETAHGSQDFKGN